MKVLKLSLFLFAILSITACGDDDDQMAAVCSQSDWVGTYSGTITCVEDGDTDTEDVTVTITASGADNIIVSYEQPGITTTYDPLPFTNCEFSLTASEQGITLTSTGETDGNNITLTEIYSAGTESSTCTIEATRD
ncbi:hypothetical protein FUA23_20225 [Neolewinella aurantiaca]|uniref:Lipocalin-like domain-containing protein n=1 Tax=Neolewinella aurantiaca TaxID=2602767 RepID=A0A5C7FLR6_9BACT|nr:hypothetical protein [Neolewinella aurantiaca]TXF85685.1 hypothetical protein FUA23_20225 [Neolewinella aurantiaca]